MRPAAAEVAQALRLAYGSAPEEIERCRRGLGPIARLLTAGEGAQHASTRCSSLSRRSSAEAMAKLAHAASLQKDNPNWADQPGVPGGNPDGGE